MTHSLTDITNHWQSASAITTTSAVEVCYHLLGYGPDFTNVPDWSFLNLTALYWSIFRRWPRLRGLAGQLTDAEEPPETIPLREGGRTLLHFDAYAFKGPILRDLCLYDYMSMISLQRRQGGGDDESHICLEGRPFVQRHESFYQEFRRIQGGLYLNTRLLPWKMFRP